MKGAIAMKQLKRLLRKKGFTISEVLVAMMIFAIMTAIVMQILACLLYTSDAADD